MRPHPVRGVVGQQYRVPGGLCSARDAGLYSPHILDEVVPTEVLSTVALKGEPFTAFRRLQRPGLVLQFDNEDVTVAFDSDVDVDRFVYTW